MSALTRLAPRSQPATRSRLRRLLVPVAVVAGAALLAFGLRVGTTYGQAWWAARQVAPVTASTQMPTNPQIEDRWGVRITLVQLLADNGLVELRYQVLDNGKANRLHADSTSLANIPSIGVDGTDQVIKSTSLLFHIHHEWDQGSDGRSYSIVYGNSGGVVHPRGRVTILMPDGLQLQHAPVTG